MSIVINGKTLSKEDEEVMAFGMEMYVFLMTAEHGELAHHLRVAMSPTVDLDTLDQVCEKLEETQDLLQGFGGKWELFDTRVSVLGFRAAKVQQMILDNFNGAEELQDAENKRLKDITGLGD